MAFHGSALNRLSIEGANGLVQSNHDITTGLLGEPMNPFAGRHSGTPEEELSYAIDGQAAPWVFEILAYE